MTMISEETAVFLAGLSENNNREWFEANKPRYEEALKRPAERFTDEMAELLKDRTGRIYKPKIFRIYRDVRFSKDKTPYNAHLHISFTPSDAGEDAPMWMIGLEPDRLVMGVGIFMFSKDGLNRWRAEIDGSGGDELALLLDGFVKKGVRIEEPELKRVPAPYLADHPHGDLLRRKGIAVWTDDAVKSEIYGENGPGNCWKRLEPFTPFFDWMVEFSED